MRLGAAASAPAPPPGALQAPRTTCEPAADAPRFPSRPPEARDHQAAPWLHVSSRRPAAPAAAPRAAPPALLPPALLAAALPAHPAPPAALPAALPAAWAAGSAAPPLLEHLQWCWRPTGAAPAGAAALCPAVWLAKSPSPHPARPGHAGGRSLWPPACCFLIAEGSLQRGRGKAATWRHAGSTSGAAQRGRDGCKAHEASRTQHTQHGSGTSRLAQSTRRLGAPNTNLARIRPAAALSRSATGSGFCSAWAWRCAGATRFQMLLRQASWQRECPLGTCGATPIDTCGSACTTSAHAQPRSAHPV